MAKGGPKQYPNLAMYLDSASKPRATDPRLVLLATLATFGAMATIFAIGVGVASHNFLLQRLPELFTAIGVAVSCAFGSMTIAKSLPPRPKPTPLELEAREVIKLLKYHLKERRLHKAGPDAVVTLLEESARQYVRIQATLSSSFWKGGNLPPQYSALRDKAQFAADRTMEEIIVLLRPRIAEDTKPQHWKDVVDEVAETMGFKSPDRGYVFPGDLDPVARLAEGLRNLANEVEQTSIRAVTDLSSSSSANAALRTTLSELRALNDAESELDDSLRFRS